MLAAEDVHFSIGQNKILNGVTLALEDGKIHGMIGPSGSGKTSLLRIFSMLDRPDSGRMVYNATHWDYPNPVSKLPTPPWPEIAVVFQQLFLWPHMTVRQNLLFAVAYRDADENKELLYELSAQFGLDRLLDRYPHQMSLGQKQRVALARALMLKPRVLMLDEVSASLDVEQTSRVVDYMMHIRGGGASILLITHLLGFAKALSDEIVFFEEGKVVEKGPVKILTRPQTERLARFLSVVNSG